MVLTLISVGYVYVLCGILAYGLNKGRLRNFYSNLTYCGYDQADECLCNLIAIFGPLGLIVAIVLSLLEDRFGFCFIMPQKLCKGSGQRSS